MNSLDWKISALIGGLVVIGLGLLEKFTGAFSSLGKGVAGLGTGIQTGVSAIFSPSITPTFLPTVGIQLCLQPFTGPCTTSTRETGNVAGSGTGSSGFHTLMGLKGASFPSTLK